MGHHPIKAFFNKKKSIEGFFNWSGGKAKDALRFLVSRIDCARRHRSSSSRAWWPLLTAAATSALLRSSMSVAWRSFSIARFDAGQRACSRQGPAATSTSWNRPACRRATLTPPPQLAVAAQMRMPEKHFEPGPACARRPSAARPPGRPEQRTDGGAQCHTVRRNAAMQCFSPTRRL